MNTNEMAVGRMQPPITHEFAVEVFCQTTWYVNCVTNSKYRRAFLVRRQSCGSSKSAEMIWAYLVRWRAFISFLPAKATLMPEKVASLIHA